MLQRVASRLPALILLLAAAASAAQELRPKETLIENKAGVFVQGFTPDGKTLIFAADDKLHFWDLQAKKVGVVIPWPAGVSTLSADGKMAAVAVRDGDIQLTDTATGKVRATLRGHTKRVSALAFSPDGKLLASASQDQFIKLWDLATTKEVRARMMSDGRPYRLVFSPDGQALASRDSLGSVTVWGVPSGEVRCGIEASVFEAYLPILFLADGKLLVTTKEKKTLVAGGSKTYDIVIRDRQTGEIAGLAGNWKEEITTLVVSPDGKLLLSLSEENPPQSWDLSGRRHNGQLGGAKGRVASAAFSPDGKTLATGGGRWDEKELKFTSGEVLLWDVASVGKK